MTASKLCGYVLDAGADVNVANNKGETPLYKTVGNTTAGAAPIAQLLLERGADSTIQLTNGSSARPGLVEVFADLP